MTLILTNLDFEMTWARTAGDQHTLPALILKLASRWRHILKLIAPDAHALSLESTLPGALPPGELTSQTLIPWGWTPQLLHFAKRAGLHTQAPPLAAVQLVNSKKFSHHLEKNLHIALPHAAWIDDIQALPTALEALNGPWILKDPWGVSGRGQRRGEGNSLSPALRRWAENLISNQGGLLLEPRLTIHRELSLHFQIKPDQTVHFIGTCGLISGKEGTLRALEVQQATDVPPAIFDGAHQAAQAVAAQGYFGPLGIDTMIGDWKGETIHRPITEINARWTFGRMALALFERLPQSPAHACLYWHFTAHSKEAPPLKDWPKTWAEGSFHLPRDIDPDRQSQSFVKLRPHPS